MDSSWKLLWTCMGMRPTRIIRFSQCGLLASGCPETSVLKANQVSTNQVLSVKNLMNVGSGLP